MIYSFYKFPVLITSQFNYIDSQSVKIYILTNHIEITLQIIPYNIRHPIYHFPIPRYVPVPGQSLYLHVRPPRNKTLIFLLFCISPVLPVLKFSTDGKLPAVSYLMLLQGRRHKLQLQTVQTIF